MKAILQLIVGDPRIDVEKLQDHTILAVYRRLVDGERRDDLILNRGLYGSGHS